MSNFTPRIIVSVHADTSCTCKGVYIDAKENKYSFNRVFNSENQAMDYLYNMRELNNEFSIQVNRKA